MYHKEGDVGEILKFDQTKLGPNAQHPAPIGVYPETVDFRLIPSV